MKLHTACVFFGAIVLGLGGCIQNEAPKIAPRYPTLPPKVVAAFLKGTILERVDLADIDPLRVANFAMVNNLNSTGDGTAPTAVREYMSKELLRHHMPAELIDDKRMAVVAVSGLIPPGARKDQWFDVSVYALESNNTTSLLRGNLLRADLKENGDNPMMPGGSSPTVWAQAQGPIFINPGYAIDTAKNDSAARLARRVGVVLGGGLVSQDRPIMLRLREPDRRVSRAIADRINYYFQRTVASPRDEGLVELLMPESYDGDYAHFSGVVRHMYLITSPDFVAVQTGKLCAEIAKPGLSDDQVMEISYCLEGMGTGALSQLAPLMESTDVTPRVNFACARAAAYIGEPTAQMVLMRMAMSKDHPFQLQAVAVLGTLGDSPSVNMQLAKLLEADSSNVRIEAYRLLARRKHPSVITNLVNNRFALDIVPSKAPPIVFATRQGVPRLAIIGSRIELIRPIMFSAMDHRLSITADATGGLFHIFYRGPELDKPASAQTGADLGEIITRLGDSSPIRLSYGEIVAIVQQMCAGQMVSGLHPSGNVASASFVLQEPPRSSDEIDNAPSIDGSRSQNSARSDAAQKQDAVKN